jgi:hypothetical protein
MDVSDEMRANMSKAAKYREEHTPKKRDSLGRYA